MLSNLETAFDAVGAAGITTVRYEAMYEFGPFTNLTRTALHHDLKPYLADGVLHHPLLYADWIDPRLYSRLNQLYELRLRCVAGLNAVLNEWQRLRPDLTPFERTSWLLKQSLDENLGHELRDRQSDYHRLVGQLWTDPEILSHTSDTLRILFQPGLPSKPIDDFMVDSERQRLAEFPEELQVFRGHVPVLERNLSWTLNPSIAVDWACRCDPGICRRDQHPEYQFFAPIVTVGIVRKSQIIAYVNRRHEDEILVNSDYVRDRQSYDLICSEAC